MRPIANSSKCAEMRKLGGVGRADCLANAPPLSYAVPVKTLTIRLPESLVAEIEHESQSRNISKSDIVRERLATKPRKQIDHPLSDILAEIDRSPVTGPKRNGALDKKRLPEIIRAHYRAAKRHY
jgi:hypothetical protein